MSSHIPNTRCLVNWPLGIVNGKLDIKMDLMGMYGREYIAGYREIKKRGSGAEGIALLGASMDKIVLI